jgi:hypothetical protein
MVDWKAVTEFFNGVVQDNRTSNSEDLHLEVKIYSPSLDKTLSVVIPDHLVVEFMKHVPTFEAKVWGGREFCTSCNGPYGDWLEEQYDGHWDSCQYRPKGKPKVETEPLNSPLGKVGDVVKIDGTSYRINNIRDIEGNIDVTLKLANFFSQLTKSITFNKE